MTKSSITQFFSDTVLPFNSVFDPMDPMEPSSGLICVGVLGHAALAVDICNALRMVLVFLPLVFLPLMSSNE